MASFLLLLSYYKYAALFAAAFLEGPIAMITTGFLIKLGHVDLVPAYMVLMGGDFFGDIAWYVVGYFGAHKLVRAYGKFFSLTESILDKVILSFRKHEGRILFLSKLTTGFGLAVGVLVAAGIAHVPFKKFASINFFGGFIWTALMLFVGYSFGGTYLYLAEELRMVFLVFIVLLVVSALYGFGRFMRQRFLKNNV